MTSSDADLLAEQKEYYRERAGEYDEWFERGGRYDHGPEFRVRWEAEVAEVQRILAAFDPAGRVLELAGGTGWWTEELVKYADRLTVVDASAEVLELNRRRVPDPRVRRLCTDVFEWRPDGEYDVVFFSFWLSHVPPGRFDAFWERVASALAPGGRVCFVDSLRSELSPARDHRLAAPGEVVSERKLNDGRRFRIVKVFYHPAALQARLEALGWRASVAATEHFFLHGHAERSLS
jgi:SAM-dependent methyltransferase